MTIDPIELDKLLHRLITEFREHGAYVPDWCDRILALDTEDAS